MSETPHGALVHGMFERCRASCQRSHGGHVVGLKGMADANQKAKDQDGCHDISVEAIRAGVCARTIRRFELQERRRQ